MKFVQCVLFGVLIGLVPGIAHAQVTFNGVGSPSTVRDATRVGADVYAVGGAGPDAALWTWNGTSFVLTLLPDPIPGATPGVAAFAISLDGVYIASQARVLGGNLVATRVTRSDLTTSDLGFPNLGVPSVPIAAARAISANGQILYGLIGSSSPPSTPFRAAQYNNGVTRLIPQFLNQTGLPLSNQPIFRGTSSDGLTMVGTNGGGTGPSAGRTFRYDSVTNTNALIPLPAGASFNSGLGVSSDGNLTLLSMGGNNLFTKGEVYFHSASPDAITLLGSPNPAWSPQGFGGMTADGAVVSTSFGFGTARAGYFHNANGWFDLMSALAKGGVDIVSTAGWSQLFVTGMSADGTLVFGRGVHDTNLADAVPGSLEGFVAEFPLNFLKNFSAPAVPPANTALVGAWLLPVNPSNPGNPPVMVFLADGTFFLIETVPSSIVTGGFERGTYSWDAATGAFGITTLHSTKGDYGLSEANGALGMTLVVNGDNAMFHAPDGDTSATRIVGGVGNLVGGWYLPDPGAATPDPSDDFPAVLVLLSDGTYYLAQDGVPEPGGHPGIEKGTYSWSPAGISLAGPFSGIALVDTDGAWGFSNPSGSTTLALAPDGLVATATDDAGSFSFARIVDPNMVAPVITSDLSVAGTVGTLFTTYTVMTAYPALTVHAAPLPAGLLVDAATGEVSGTPTEAGIFAVTITASNTLATRTAILHLTIASTVETNAGTAVLVIPVVPAGTPALTLTFDQVAVAGQTTVAVVDPEVTPTTPPSGFQFGDPPQYYEIETTAILAPDTSVALCFSYAGIDFGGNTPRLFHYVHGAWVDITTSVDAVTQAVCGTTSSFSPFAIFSSPKTFQKGLGFYSPVSPLAGFINTAKGGSTVPLKFNVTVNGIQKTDVSGLVFGTSTVACTLAPEDPVDYVTVDTTNLRWDPSGQQFIQNWKTPKTPGCYIARITTATGLEIRATFRLK